MKMINLCLAIFLLSAMACEKTIDSETNRWSHNQARLERLSSEYPNFSIVFQNQLKEAKAAFEKAQAITNEEAKIAAMDKANDLAAVRFVSDLDNLDKKVEELRETSLKLMEYSENNKGIIVAGFKTANVESAIKECKSYLSVVSPKNSIQAEQAVNKAVGPLNRMQKSMSNSIRDIERAQRAKESENVAKK